ncbi:hypothetical protein GGQ92_001774 [Gracilibacillus halotolerans]|uniref:DUF4352 domain-containing protein n=1 Tax=Gracilibacillus halotolerans TaxID=74386 RepID=A0A841RP87_9BACI|nr:hypothetical protein [Gracilibacillus halotolerans]MBB6512985.1 hypothetical protein [Gracilibacillus halotolerans]
MKKLLWTLMLAGILVIAGCGGSEDEPAEEENTTDTVNETENNDNEAEESTEEVEEEPVEEVDTEQPEENSDTGGSGLDQASRDMPDLKLQVQKADEEAGITTENNEIYKQLVDVINADPKAGIPNDFSVYPHDLVQNEDGSTSVLFIGVNRLNRPIHNISFDLTLGDVEGNYIFDGQEVLLDENGVGVIQPHSAVPFLLGITEEDQDIFMSLTESNVEIRLDNAQVDYGE